MIPSERRRWHRATGQESGNKAGPCGRGAVWGVRGTRQRREGRTVPLSPCPEWSRAPLTLVMARHTVPATGKTAMAKAGMGQRKLWEAHPGASRPQRRGWVTPVGTPVPAQSLGGVTPATGPARSLTAGTEEQGQEWDKDVDRDGDKNWDEDGNG